MAVNPDQLWNTLDKIEQKLLSIVDDFDAVSQAAVALNGDIAKVLPIQLNASADTILDLVNGEGQNSIKNLKEYIDNIPLGQLRTKSTAEAIRNGQATAPTAGNAPTAAEASIAPKTTEPQSAIVANESINLDDYKKASALKESSKLNEDNEFSFDAILDDNDIDNEGYDSSIPVADEDYLDNDYSSEFEQFDDSNDEEFDFDKFEDARLADQGKDSPTFDDAFDFNKEI